MNIRFESEAGVIELAKTVFDLKAVQQIMALVARLVSQQKLVNMKN